MFCLKVGYSKAFEIMYGKISPILNCSGKKITDFLSVRKTTLNY